MAGINTTQKAEEFRKTMRAYAGFQMATALLVVSKVADVHGACIVVSLIAVNIPSPVTFSGINSSPKKIGKLNPLHISNLCFIMSFIPSIAALSILFASVSIFAGVAFAVASLFWTITSNAIKSGNP